MECSQKVKARIREAGLISPGSRVIAAVSGGPDSMALLTILYELAAELNISLAAAHYDHRIRDASKRDRAIVERYAVKLGLPVLLGCGNVPAAAKRAKAGLEETARKMRFRFLDEAARDWSADAVALGHTKDDQVETILHHIIRGTGWRGLTGIAEKRGIYIRPLLACERSELKAFLRSRHVRYVADESNLDNRLLRNRIRNRLLPYLRKHFNPAVDDSLVRLQENIREGWEALSESVQAALPHAEGDGSYGIDLVKLAQLPDFSVYLVIDTVLREHFGVIQDMEKIHFDSAKKLIRSGRSGGRVQLPHGVTIVKEQREIRFTRESGREQRKIQPSYVLLPGPGTYRLSNWNLDVTIREVTAQAMRTISDEREAFLANICFPVSVRARKAGDRMVPFGMKGRKKLSDIFIDCKIPLRRRDTIPVFEDGAGIIWVPGVATDERTRISPRIRKSWHFTLSDC